MMRILAVLILAVFSASALAEDKAFHSYRSPSNELNIAPSCQTGPDVFDYSPFRSNTEAEKLAINLSGQMRAPEREYTRILRDLQLIRAEFPEIAFISSRTLYAPNQMLIRLIDGQPEDAYNALNAYYQVVEDRTISNSLNIHLLTFCGNLNIPLLTSLYVAPNIRYAEPNSSFGDGDRISVERFGSVYRYHIKTGCGDCLSGCIYNRRWIIDVDAYGNLTLTSFVDSYASCFVDCCLPQGACLNIADNTCRWGNGIQVSECYGDDNCDGLDDACPDEFLPSSNTVILNYNSNPCIQKIDIDIMPGSDSNTFQLGGKGVLPVAIYTTNLADGDIDDFDAADVDTTSLSLAGATPMPRDNVGHAGILTDIDADGDLDLLLHFPIVHLDITESDALAVLVGYTMNGAYIFGRDLISGQRIEPAYKIYRFDDDNESRRMKFPR